MTPTHSLFTLLSRFRHLPAYQLERRADIFFAVYLPAYVSKLYSVPLSPIVIPELPIKRDLIWPDTPTSKSVKVDYCLSAADQSRVFLVELKTDSGSRRDAQDTYLQRAKDLGFRRIVAGIREIVQATSAHQKYFHLTTALAQLGHLRLAPDLADHLYPEPGTGLRERLASIEVTDLNPPIEIIYLQPHATEGDHCIDFRAFADFVRGYPDELSQLFATSLEAWIEPAGSVRPS